MAGTRWTGKGHSHSWFNATNWSQGVPMAQQNVAFTDGHNWTIDLAGNAHAASGSMTVLGDALLFKSGTLDLAAAPPNSGNPVDLSIGRGGSVTVSAGATFTSQNVIAVGAVVGGTLTAGNLTVAGVVQGSILEVFDGSANIAGAHAHLSLANNGGFFASVEGGTLNVSAGARLDAGPHSLQNQYASLDIGGPSGDGIVNVADAGTTIELSAVYMGYDRSGTLNVSNGATMHLNVVSTDGYGEVHVLVTGAGSLLTAARAVNIGADYSLSGLTLSVLNGGSVNIGSYGLTLQYGELLIDASSHLTGRIASQVGSIGAQAVSVADPGTVTLTQSITLESNQGAQGQYDYTTNVFSTGGAVLNLQGVISSFQGGNLQIGGGDVVLGNTANSYVSTALAGGILDVAASGAAGAGALTFTAAAQAPTLQIDAGVAFTNTIAGFAAGDTIDLRGFAFGAGVTDSFAAGTLTLSDGSTTTSLSLAGNYTAASFAFADDHHGGTAITFVPGSR